MLKIGVVGAGHLGKYHIQNIQALEGAELVGFYDIDPHKARSVAREYGATKYTDFDKLLAASDGISIVVPTKSHFEIARKALEKGVHVFCEKPFMDTIQEANEIIHLARQRQLVLQVGHIERFNPALASLGKHDIHPLFIESHRIAPFHPRGTDVAVILDLMIHDIDIILSLVDSDIDQIDAAGAPVLTDKIDIANARLKFANGCVANVTASRVSAKQLRKLRIFQRNAYISIDFLKNESRMCSLSEDMSQMTEGQSLIAELDTAEHKKKVILLEQLETRQSNALREELKAFVKSIEQGTDPPVTGEDGKKALEIALQIEEQINRNLESLAK